MFDVFSKISKSQKKRVISILSVFANGAVAEEQLASLAEVRVNRESKREVALNHEGSWRKSTLIRNRHSHVPFSAPPRRRK